MSRFSFAFDPEFVVRDRSHCEPAKPFVAQISFVSWTMLSAVAFAAATAALVWFG